jgi:hypothetical protein
MEIINQHMHMPELRRFANSLCGVRSVTLASSLHQIALSRLLESVYLHQWSLE